MLHVYSELKSKVNCTNFGNFLAVLMVQNAFIVISRVVKNWMFLERKHCPDKVVGGGSRESYGR